MAWKPPQHTQQSSDAASGSKPKPVDFANTAAGKRQQSGEGDRSKLTWDDDWDSDEQEEDESNASTSTTLAQPNYQMGQSMFTTNFDAMCGGKCLTDDDIYGELDASLEYENKRYEAWKKLARTPLGGASGRYLSAKRRFKLEVQMAPEPRLKELWDFGLSRGLFHEYEAREVARLYGIQEKARQREFENEQLKAAWARRDAFIAQAKSLKSPANVIQGTAAMALGPNAFRAWLSVQYAQTAIDLKKCASGSSAHCESAAINAGTATAFRIVGPKPNVRNQTKSRGQRRSHAAPKKGSAKSKGAAKAWGTGTRLQRAQTIANEAANALKVNLANLVDEVRYVRGNSSFYVETSGKRVLNVGSRAFRRTKTGQVMEAIHELAHAMQYDRALRKAGGNVQVARQQFFGHAFGSKTYSWDEAVAERLSRIAAARYLGTLSPQQRAASTRYIREWLDAWKNAP
jgi:hypothetical protein